MVNGSFHGGFAWLCKRQDTQTKLASLKSFDTVYVRWKAPCEIYHSRWILQESGASSKVCLPSELIRLWITKKHPKTPNFPKCCAFASFKPCRPSLGLSQKYQRKTFKRKGWYGQGELIKQRGQTTWNTQNWGNFPRQTVFKTPKLFKYQKYHGTRLRPPNDHVPTAKTV